MSRGGERSCDAGRHKQSTSPSPALLPSERCFSPPPRSAVAPRAQSRDGAICTGTCVGFPSLSLLCPTGSTCTGTWGIPGEERAEIKDADRHFLRVYVQLQYIRSATRGKEEKRLRGRDTNENGSWKLEIPPAESSRFSVPDTIGPCLGILLPRGM